MAETQWLLVVTAQIDPSVEAEWNRWYDEVHVPEILACPGVHRAVRCESDLAPTARGLPAQPGRGYIAIYDIDGPQVLETPEFAKARGWRQFTDQVKSVTRVYRKRGSFGA